MCRCLTLLQHIASPVQQLCQGCNVHAVLGTEPYWAHHAAIRQIRLHVCACTCWADCSESQHCVWLLVMLRCLTGQCCLMDSCEKPQQGFACFSSTAAGNGRCQQTAAKLACHQSTKGSNTKQYWLARMSQQQCSHQHYHEARVTRQPPCYARQPCTPS